MQDVRLRIGMAMLLSLAAFASIAGAAATFLWLLLFSGKITHMVKVRLLLPVAAMLAFFSAVLALTGGDGISYFLRMMVVLLVGFWVYTEKKEGEFLQLGVWLLGDRWGFELGMIADMSMQTVYLLVRDFDHIRIAESLKGIQPGWKALVPAGGVLVNGALIRAENTAELLAVRGYRNGGSLCPGFITPRRDILIASIAVCMLLIALVPVSEFFILYR